MIFYEANFKEDESMNINWKVRMKNPTFWRNIIIAVVAPILAYLGVNWEEITTWTAFFDLFAQAVANPVILVSVICSVWNALNDPTTEGLSDSKQALTYTKPKAK